MDEKVGLDQFGYYSPERIALHIVYLRRTGVACNIDKEFYVRFYPTKEQWEKIDEVLKDG